MNVTTQPPIELYDSPIAGSEDWEQPERAYFSDIFNTNVVTNVTTPTLTPVVPDAPNGTAIIVNPGGGFHALSIDSEGFEVARWLAERGVTAFVLKYRLVQSEGDAVADLIARMEAGTSPEAMAAIAPLAAADGIQAVRYVRDHAAEYGVDAQRIGMIGFSAGAHVLLRVALAESPDAELDFLAPIYAPIREVELPSEPTPRAPMFLAAASDDSLGLALDSIRLYELWQKAGAPVELHMYAAGGHGFGMRRQGLPSDTWIDRFGDFLTASGLM